MTPRVPFLHFQYNGDTVCLFCCFFSLSDSIKCLVAFFSTPTTKCVCCICSHLFWARVCPSRSTSSSPFTISNLKSVPVMAFSIISYYLIAFELCRRAGGCRLLNVLMLFSLFSSFLCCFVLSVYISSVSRQTIFCTTYYYFPSSLFLASYVFLFIIQNDEIVKMIMVRLFEDDCL